MALEGPQAERMEAVRRFVRHHADEPLDRARLAAVAGFSVPHFHRLWRLHTGENVAAYLRRVRLRRAALKLRMGAVDITEVGAVRRIRDSRGLHQGVQAAVWLQPEPVPRPGLLGGDTDAA